MDDLAKVAAAAEAGAVMEVKDNAGEPMIRNGKPVTIKFAGTESSKWRKARSTVGNKYIKAGAGNRGSLGPRTTEEAIDDLAFEFASVTLSWDGIADGGQELECNLENAKRIYAKYDFLRNQITEFLNDQRNFSTASSTS